MPKMRDDFWKEEPTPYIQNAIDKLRPKADGVHCICCGKALTGRQETFCSYHCYTENFKKYNWSEIQKRIIQRDGNQCKFDGCKETKNLTVHHIKKVKESPELVMEDSNLLTLCRKHHEYYEKLSLPRNQCRLFEENNKKKEME